MPDQIYWAAHMPPLRRSSLRYRTVAAGVLNLPDAQRSAVVLQQAAVFASIAQRA